MCFFIFIFIFHREAAKCQLCDGMYYYTFICIFFLPTYYSSAVSSFNFGHDISILSKVNAIYGLCICFHVFIFQILTI